MCLRQSDGFCKCAASPSAFRLNVPLYRIHKRPITWRQHGRCYSSMQLLDSLDHHQYVNSRTQLGREMRRWRRRECRLSMMLALMDDRISPGCSVCWLQEHVTEARTHGRTGRLTSMGPNVRRRLAIERARTTSVLVDTTTDSIIVLVCNQKANNVATPACSDSNSNSSKAATRRDRWSTDLIKSKIIRVVIYRVTSNDGWRPLDVILSVCC
jgi:hypothetical protein